MAVARGSELARDTAAAHATAGPGTSVSESQAASFRGYVATVFADRGVEFMT